MQKLAILMTKTISRAQASNIYAKMAQDSLLHIDQVWTAHTFFLRKLTPDNLARKISQLFMDQFSWNKKHFTQNLKMQEMTILEFWFRALISK